MLDIRRGCTVALAVVASCQRAPHATTPASNTEARVPAVVQAVDPQSSSSDPPGPEAWKSASRVRIQGDELLACSARSLAGWVEITCGENGFLGGPPARILIDPKTVGARASANRLVFRWHEGSSIRTTFEWPPMVVFEASWPTGEHEPKLAGRFRGVPDFPAREVAAFICSCAPLFYGQPASDDCNLGSGFGGALECLRAHFGSRDCQAYRECITMEPGAWGECEPDEQHTSACPSCRCALQCGEGKPDCPPGMGCEPGLHDEAKKECLPE